MVWPGEKIYTFFKKIPRNNKWRENREMGVTGRGLGMGAWHFCSLQNTLLSIKSLSSNGHVKMRFCIALLCILVALLAIIVGRVYQRLLNVPVPDDFPENSTWQFKLVGFSFGLAKDVVSSILYKNCVSKISGCKNKTSLR